MAVALAVSLRDRDAPERAGRRRPRSNLRARSAARIRQ